MLAAILVLIFPQSRPQNAAFATRSLLLASSHCQALRV
jgi:hypothetical protein